MGQPIVQAVGVKAWMLMALIITAVGGSLIKPSIVGTVARTTTEETKAVGYSIYYTLVNIGGAMGPIIALAVRENAGISYVLVVSASTSFRAAVPPRSRSTEPARPVDAPPPRTMAQVLRDMMLVFGNLRFMLVPDHLFGLLGDVLAHLLCAALLREGLPALLRASRSSRRSMPGRSSW